MAIEMAKKRKILTVRGSWSEVYPHLYQEIDPSVEVVMVKDRSDVLQEAHGVLLQGGSDINPFLYGEEAKFAMGVNPKRDDLEMTLIKKAVSQRLPILGICRGHQMLAVAFGGSLHQDMVRNQVVAAPHSRYHDIEVWEPMMERIIPTILVNSSHHQAVRRVPQGFRTAAVSLDGVIESIYTPGILGVQWHPEALWMTDPWWANLFYWHLRGFQPKDRGIAKITKDRKAKEKVRIALTRGGGS